MVVAHRQRQGIVTPVVFGLRVGARLQEYLGQIFAPFARRHHQWRRAVGRLGVDLGATGNQLLGEVGVAVEHGVMQCAPVVAVAIEIGAVRQQPGDGVNVVVPSGQLQGLLAIAVGASGIGAALDEERHHRHIAVPGRDHQPCTDFIALELGIQPFVQPFPHPLDLVAFDRPAKFHRVRGCRPGNLARQNQKKNTVPHDCCPPKHPIHPFALPQGAILRWVL